MVSGTRALLFIFESYMEGSRAADPKGMKSCRTQGRIACVCVCVHAHVPDKGVSIVFLKIGPQIPEKSPLKGKKDGGDHVFEEWGHL